MYVHTYVHEHIILYFCPSLFTHTVSMVPLLLGSLARLHCIACGRNDIRDLARNSTLLTYVRLDQQAYGVQPLCDPVKSVMQNVSQTTYDNDTGKLRGMKT